MVMQDITDWASNSRIMIELSHGFGEARYQLKLREFVPVEGDTLYEAWSDGSVLKKHYIPPFAIENMKDTAFELQRYVDSSIVKSACKLVGLAHPLIWETYQMTIEYAHEAPVRFALSKSSPKSNAVVESRSSEVSQRCLTVVAYVPHDKYGRKHLQQREAWNRRG